MDTEVKRRMDSCLVQVDNIKTTKLVRMNWKQILPAWLQVIAFEMDSLEVYAKGIPK